MEECTVKISEKIVDLAVRLGSDRPFASRVRERIRATSDVLFQNHDVVREFERSFKETTLEAWQRTGSAAYWLFAHPPLPLALSVRY